MAVSQQRLAGPASIAGPASLLVAGLVVALAAAPDRASPIVFVAGALLGLLLPRPFVLGVAAFVVLLGSARSEGLADALFYPRFLMYGSVFGSCLLTARRTRWSRPEQRCAIALGGFALVAAASVAWSVDAPLSAARASTFLLLMGMIAASSLRWDDEGKIATDFSALAIAASVVGALNLFAYILAPEWAFDRSRFQGILQNPNTIGVSAGIALPLALGLRLRAVGFRRHLWTLAAICLFLPLVASQSRGGIVAALAGLGVLWLRTKKRSARHLVAAALTIIVGLVGFGAVRSIAPELIPSQLDRAYARFAEPAATETQGSGRLAAWDLALSIWAERPLTGWGFGTTEETFGARSGSIIDVFLGQHPHNGFLEVLLEIGPLGALLIVVALGTALLQLLRDRHDPLRAGVAGAFFGGLVLTGVESGITSAGSIYGFYFWFMFAGVLRLSALGRHEAAEAAVPTPRQPRSLAFGAEAR